MAGKISQMIEVVLSFRKANTFPKDINKQMSRYTDRFQKIHALSRKFGVDTNRVNRALQSQGVQWKEGAGFIDAAGGKVTKFNKVMKKGINTTRMFNMNLLSIMFFGMAIQRVFQGIARSAITTFTKIMESNDMLGTAVQRLGVHFGYLKFVIGSALNTALEPLLPKIINIINTIGNWVQENPKLATTIIIVGFAIGFLLFTVGMLGLGLSGLAAIIGQVALISFPALAASIGSVLLNALILLILVYSIVEAVRFLTATIKGEEYKANEKNIFTKIGSSVVNLLRIVYVGAVAMGIFIGTLLYTIGEGFVGIIKVASNLITGFLEGVLNTVIRAVNIIISAINRVSKANIPTLEEVAFGRLEVGNFENISEAWRNAAEYAGGLFEGPIEGLAETWGGPQEVNQENTINIYGGDPEETRRMIQEESDRVLQEMQEYS